MPGEAQNGELLKAQFAIFTRHIPLMYSIILLSAWSLAMLSRSAAPTWLVVYVPVVFTTLCIIRMISWYRARNQELSAEKARLALVRTNWLAAILAVFLGGWALTLYQYGDTYVKLNITFFIAITGVCVVVCLLHLRSAAFSVALLANTPIIVQLTLSNNTHLLFMAFNMLIVTVTLMVVVYVQSEYFQQSVQAKVELETVSKTNLDIANLDSLTGLANRRQFFATLQSAFENASDRNERLAVGIIDLDGFKPVNDLHGHYVGDKLLYEVGQRLRAFTKETVHVARLGGDEFAMVIENACDDDKLILMGENICAALSVPFELDDVNVLISGTVGLAVYPTMAQTAQLLYERADYALYHSKRSRRGHPILFSKEQACELARNSSIEQALLSADLDAELEVYFQPIIDIETQRPIALEALARWNSQVLGHVPPSSFIPIAERTGNINIITRLLLEKALKVASTWPKGTKLSFNLSANDVGSHDALLRIVSIVLSSGFNPRMIDFEITETAVMQNFMHSEQAIETLRALGCGIALDDFGTGFSSLSQLHALPLTKIKIDRSFVCNLDQKQTSHKIVKSLLALSRDMGLGCVVEGVETQQELDMVISLGGETVQGYYFSPPVRADETANLFHARLPEEPSEMRACGNLT